MNRTLPRLGLLAGAALLAVLTGCSQDSTSGDSADPTASTRPQATTSTPQTSTSTTVKPTTSEAPTPSSTPTRAVAEGSGCAPGGGALPDGTWYGYVTAADGDSVEFDLACFFRGQSAVVAASEDGSESPPPNDYYIRNVNTELRSLQVEPLGEVTWYPDLGDPASQETISYTDWVQSISGRNVQAGVWIEIGNGLVLSIDEQWVP